MVVVKFPENKIVGPEKISFWMRCGHWLNGRSASIATIYLTLIILVFVSILFIISLICNMLTFFLIKRLRITLPFLYRGIKRWFTATIGFFISIFHPSLGIAMVRFDTILSSSNAGIFSWIIPHMADLVWSKYQNRMHRATQFFNVIQS